MLSAILWTVGIVVIVLVVIGIPYVLAGYAQYTVQNAVSGVLPVDVLKSPQIEQLSSCIPAQDIADLGSNAVCCFTCAYGIAASRS